MNLDTATQASIPSSEYAKPFYYLLLSPFIAMSLYGGMDIVFSLVL